MAGELAGKVAVVTGGALGIGRATVEEFVREGARVVIADIQDEPAAELARSLGEAASFLRTDVSDQDQVSALVEHAVATFGGLHVMVNNAAVSGPARPLLDDDFAAFDRILQVNLLGVMAGTRLAARHMAQHGGGSIINVTSIGGVQPGRGVMTYRASKAGVIQFSKSAAIELGEHGIRVNCIAPGSIPTSLMESLGAGLTGEALERFVARQRAEQAASRPLNREGTPQDVAHAATFLASDKAGYISGTVLAVDGATSAGKAAASLPAIASLEPKGHR